MTKFDEWMEDETAESKDMIGKIVGVVFALYVVAYAGVTAILALVNGTVGFAANSPIPPILSTLVPILVALGFGWMFYKHMSLK